MPAAAAVMLLAAGHCAAAATPSPSPAPVTPDYHAPGGMLQMAVYFILIVAVLIAGLYFTRSGMAGMTLGKGGKSAKKLVISEARTLGNRQFLVVAEYEEKKMLLGVCPGRIDYLATLGGGDDAFSKELEEKPE